MRIIAHTFVAACVLACTALAKEPPKGQQETDITLSGLYYKPGDDDSYDNGYGGEIQLRLWTTPTVGFALAVGGASWDVNDAEFLVSDGVVAVAAEIDGDVTIIPVGGSILFRPVNDDKIALILEAGIRYVIVDSNAKVAVAVADIFGNVAAVEDTVHIDDGMIGVVAAHIEAQVGQNASLLFGLGYQFDLVEGDAEWAGEDFGDNELKALIVRAGVAIQL